MKRGRLSLSINALRGTAALFALLSIHSAQGASPAWLTARDEEARALVAKMTLAEKVGQMTQPDWKALKDRKDVGGLFLGSLLCGGSSDSDSGNTLKDWTGVYDEAQKQALGTRLAIPLVFGVDAVHGNNNVLGAVVFPHNVGLGCTRDPELIQRISEVTALETRATGIQWTFAPCVAVPRDIRWGRAYEGFSEDPAVATLLGEATVRGLQGENVLACAKHFVGDGGTTFKSTIASGLLDQGDTRVDEATLRAIHMAGYPASIDAGVGTIMPSYSSWNGVKCTGSKKLLTDILKAELGFEGFVISDYNAIDQLVAPSVDESLLASNNASGQVGDSGVSGIVASDEFSRRPGDPKLPLAWQWNRNPEPRFWSLTACPGYLSIVTNRVVSTLPEATNTLTQRTFGPRSSATTSIDVSGMKDGDCAGIAAFQKRYGFVGVKMNEGAKSLVLVSADSETPEEIASVPLSGKTVHLKVECEFAPAPEVARFSYSLDGKSWTPIGRPSALKYTVPHFMGYRFALFYYSTKTAGGRVDFDCFRIGQSGPAPKVSTVAPATGVSQKSPLAPQSWITSGPLVHPIPDESHPIVAAKDPSVVFHDGRWHIFATTAGIKGWGMAHFSFTDWNKAPKAKTFHLDNNPHLAGYNCAPQVFYFRPQKKWYLIFQSPQPRFSTTDDIGDPMSWSAPQNFFEGTPKSVVAGWLDYWIICDDTHAYLFFPDDHGRIYRSRTTLADFPRGFDEPAVIMHEAKNDLFEGSCVYRIKGTNQFLLLVECIGKQGSRYYRSFVADRLDGEWKPLPGANTEETPFAGNANVRTTDGSPLWTDGVSHGELLREGSDETMTLDPKNLRFLYQGLPRGTTEPNYLLLPYRLALLKPAEAK